MKYFEVTRLCRPDYAIGEFSTPVTKKLEAIDKLDAINFFGDIARSEGLECKAGAEAVFILNADGTRKRGSRRKKRRKF